MFVFKFVCMMVIIAVVRTINPDDKHIINILGYQSPIFEFAVRRSLNTSKATIDREDLQTFTDAVSIARVINRMDRASPMLNRLLRIGDDWRAAFSKKIQSKTRRTTVNNELRQMEASVETISKKLRLLIQNSDLTVENKTAIVHSLHDNLDKIINQFSGQDSMLRNYPTLAVPLLFSLTSYVPFYNKITTGVSMVNTKPSDTISCRFAAAIVQYYEPFLLDRLTQINLVLRHSPHEADAQKKLIAATIKDLPYNKTGYRLNTTHTGDCVSGCQSRMIEDTDTIMCWNDPIENELDRHYSAG